MHDSDLNNFAVTQWNCNRSFLLSTSINNRFVYLLFLDSLDKKQTHHRLDERIVM